MDPNSITYDEVCMVIGKLYLQAASEKAILEKQVLELMTKLGQYERSAPQPPGQ